MARLLASLSDSEFPDDIQGRARIREEGHSKESDGAKKSKGLLRMLMAQLEGGHQKMLQDGLVRFLQDLKESSNFVADFHFRNNEALLGLGVLAR